MLGELIGAGGRTRVGSARLDWSLQDGLSVALSDITVDRGDGIGVDVPRAEIRLWMLPILVGDVRPRSLVFIDPRVVVDIAAITANAAREPAGVPVPTGAPAVAPP
ncbi:hypothetical protein, partial [Siculibacillus lacustris]|uniref:hypothetical protein n=1 Tax=Siculibacillus lacustris TaxID=1549641 RepID=UPI0013F17606